MIIWVDAHLSPAIATWITETFSITALALKSQQR
jgi:predicted nuclease of predicted toxin-antitoxin system